MVKDLYFFSCPDLFHKRSVAPGVKNAVTYPYPAWIYFNRFSHHRFTLFKHRQNFTAKDCVLEIPNNENIFPIECMEVQDLQADGTGIVVVWANCYNPLLVRTIDLGAGVEQLIDCLII